MQAACLIITTIMRTTRGGRRMVEWLFSPFLQYGFMQRALFGSIVLSISCAPVGVFLMLRRMSLTGDAMAHAILPGAALGFLLFGLDILPMTIGGLVVGLLVALGSGLVSRMTIQKEDASMAAFYLISLAVGVLLVSWRGSSVDLMHVLFGSVLALNDEALSLIGGIAIFTFGALAIFWRALIAECLDPLFLRSVSRIGGPVHLLFLVLVVLNLVGGFQALGTLLSVGLMMLPAVGARFWSNDGLVHRRTSPLVPRLNAIRSGDHLRRRRCLHFLRPGGPPRNSDEHPRLRPP
jgi:zinc/manganese transport system permease protein